jgi:Holliday junction resolvase
MSGRRSRDKGARVERAIVHALKAGGFAAERVPMSGAAGGRYSGPLMGRDLCLEAKARADGFRELYGWLDQRDVLIVKADRQEALVVVRLSLAVEISQVANAKRGTYEP